MATSTTAVKKNKIVSLKRLEVADLESVTTLAEEILENALASVMAGESGVLYGWRLAHAISRTFSATRGAGLLLGRHVKLAADESACTLDENPSGDPRIDLIEITGVSETASDSASVTALSSITRTPVAGEAVGTGDDTTRIFDLANAGVDNRFLQVSVDGDLVANFKLLRGTGGGGVDQIVFHTAPAASLAITADYTYQGGGVESTSSQSTRKTVKPVFSVVTGTPDPSPSIPSATSGSIVVGEIQVPAGWTGGSGSVVITYTNREYLLSRDVIQEAYHSHVPQNYGGRVTNSLRHMEQVVHGFRVYYADTNKVRIGPGWGVLGNVSFRTTTPTEVTLAPAGTGWYYLYAEVASLSSERAGSLPSFELSADEPTDRRRTSGSDTAWVYLASIYVKSIGPVVIRPFRRQGDWVMWDAAPSSDTALKHSLTTSAANYDIATACPPTGRMVQAVLQLSISTADDGEGIGGQINSNKMSGSSYAAAYPRIAGEVVASAGSATRLAILQGVLMAEQDGSARYINGFYTERNTPGTAAAEVQVAGYLDDFRTMDQSGNPLTY